MAWNRAHPEQQQAWRTANPDKVRATNKKALDKHCPAGSTCQSQRGMIQRCTKPNAIRFKHYGAKLTPCFDERWRDINVMIAEIGERPSQAHQLHRPCVNKGYSKDNAVWSVDHSESCKSKQSK